MGLFRIRNIKKNKWENGYDCQINLFGDVYLNEELMETSMTKNEKNWIINQNTGFVDKKGQFIFEDDLIMADSKDGQRLAICGVIESKFGMFGINSFDGDFYSLSFLENFDVAGNMHEG